MKMLMKFKQFGLSIQRQIIYLKVQIINSYMFKKVLVLILVISLVFSDTSGFQGATLVIKKDKSALSQPSHTYRLKPVSYASIYPVQNKQIVKVIRAEGNDGCKAFQKVIPDQNSQVFYIANGNEGRCSLNKRVHNAKRSSANGLIIVNSVYGTSTLNLMNNKDYFQVFLLEEQKGASILAQKSPFLAQINIKKAKNQQVKAEVWISSLNQKSYDVVQWWANSFLQISSLKSRVSWQPRFAYITCSGKSNSCGGDTTSCACGGLFCSPEKHGKTSNVLVREDIRQKLLYNQYSDKFFPYMKEFKLMCLQKYISSGFVEDCANSILDHLDVESSSLNQKIDNLLYGCKNPNLQQGQAQFQTKLYTQMLLDEGRFTQINNYPSITLNHEILQFKNEKQLKDQLCRKLSLQNERGCRIQINNVTVVHSAWETLLWIVFVLLLVVSVVFAVYKFKNRLRNEMNKQMKMQVSTAVEHYFSLSQTNRK